MTPRDRVRRPRPVRPGYWFAPKRFGYGATPVTPAGWIATVAYVAAIALIAWGLPTDTARMIVGGCVTLGFLALVAVKTDGGWRWRWGGE